MHFIGFIGILVILALAFLLSNNRKAINYRTVGVGLLIQVILAVFILKTPLGKTVFG
ncbi:MAG: Na+ dependent nucleoside transporter N-terminal domain-containing protein, partial [Bacteroidota bacterium]